METLAASPPGMIDPHSKAKSRPDHHTRPDPFAIPSSNNAQPELDLGFQSEANLNPAMNTLFHMHPELIGGCG